MKIIAIANQKGGVGKTTTTISIGKAMEMAGKKVLLVDLDPQANLTMCMGYEFPEEIPITLATMFKAQIVGRLSEVPEDYVLSANGMDFLPTSIELSELDYLLMTAMNREYILKRILERYKEAYDYVLIDCPPSLNLLFINALAVADEVLIPVMTQYLGVKGLELLINTILKAQANLNPSLSLAGIVGTMLDRRSNFQKGLIDEVENVYGKSIHIFESIIPLSVDVSREQAKGKTIFEVKNNTVAEAYRVLAEEVMQNDEARNG